MFASTNATVGDVLPNDAFDHGFAELYGAIAAELDSGPEPIARTGAVALRRSAAAVITAVPAPLDISAAFLPGLLKPDTRPAGRLLHELFDNLNWRHAGSENGRIRAELSAQMLTCELVGPTGMVFDDTCRVGLFAQSANLDYPERSHPAEELFVMLCGNAMWRRSGSPGTMRYPGDRIHHKSGESHASRTFDEPVIAIWVWTGDIDFDKYQLHG